MMFLFDVETLGVESTAVVLSAAIIPFKLEDEFENTQSMNDKYFKYIERALFVKFDVQEQIKTYRRSVTKSTLEWWATQPDHSRKLSFVPDKKQDVTVMEGLTKINDFCFHGDLSKNNLKSSIFWQRGGLDQLVFDSLMRSTGAEPIIPYNCWYDLRTAINLTKKDSGSGYCKIPGFDTSLVKKHDPIRDCAYDIMMLVHGV